MKNKYPEDALIEQPAIELFEKLGWKTYNGFREFDQAGGSPLGRETRSEVVLRARLRPALQKLNPNLPPETFDLAIEELTRDRSAMSLAQANREVTDLIKQQLLTIPKIFFMRNRSMKTKVGTVLDKEIVQELREQAAKERRSMNEILEEDCFEQ